MTLNCVSVSRFACVLVLQLPPTQFHQSLLSACSLCGPSLVAPRPKCFGRTFPRRRPQLRAPTDAKARRTSRLSVATPTINNFRRMVATGHSGFSKRLCSPCQFISRQALRPSAFENRSTMRSRSSARNSSTPKRLKLLLLRVSSKQCFHGFLWSRRPAAARFSISTQKSTALHSIILHMYLACLWSPLLAATRKLTRACSSAPTLPAAPESPSALAIRAPGNSDLGSTALGVNFQFRRRPAAYVCCFYRRFAGHARGASSRGNQLRGAVNPDASSRDSVNALAPPSETPSSEATLSGTPSSGFKGGAVQPPGGLPGHSDDDPDKEKRDKEIDFKRKDQFPIYSTALKSSKGQTLKSMKCEPF